MQKKVAVIGGKGGMGGLMQDLLQQADYKTVISDLGDDPLDILPEVDIVLIAVPIDSTLSVIQNITPHLTENQLIMDVTSVKKEPTKAMLLGKSAVIGLHPMFGPHVENIAQKTVVICPCRPMEWLEEVRHLFQSAGLKTVETDPDTHDLMMSLNQGLTHFLSLTFAGAVRDSLFSLDEIDPFASPIFTLDLLIAGRILAQNAELYADIQLNNPHFSKVLEQFEENVQKLKEIVDNGDRAAFISHFTELQHTFKERLESSLKTTNHLIEEINKCS